jgi:hypothetical protein
MWACALPRVVFYKVCDNEEFWRFHNAEEKRTKRIVKKDWMD